MVGNQIDIDQKTVAIWSVEKRAQLTQRIAVLSISIGVFYIIFDSANGAKEYVPFYSILLVGSALCLLFIKLKRYTVSKICLLISGLTLLTILSAWETQETGVFMYFLVLALAAVTLFGAEEKMAAILVGLLSFIGFYIAYFTDVIQITPIALSQEYIDRSFLINFAISLVALLTMLYYILTLSQQFEQQTFKSKVELLKLSEDLRESRNRFELAIRGSSAGLWEWNIIKKQIYISPGLSKLMGFKESKANYISNAIFENSLHRDDYDSFMKLRAAHLETRKPFMVECRFKLKDGNFLWVLDTGQAEWDESGNPIRMVGSVVDISDRKNAEEKIRKQNKMLEKTNTELDRFVYSTSHDLKAPLSSMLGLINIIEITNDIEEIKKCVEMIKGRVHTLNGFIQDIVTYSRNSRLKAKIENVNLGELVGESVSSLQFIVNSQKINFKQNELDINFCIDKSRLKIILNNIISNAIKYHNLNQQDPYISISASKVDTFISIKIEDNGIGIDPELKENIFDMFYRATEASDGSGLGLYITKETVEKLKGTIEVISELGKGTTFTISVPEYFSSDRNTSKTVA